MKAQPADIIRQEDIKLTPELIIIFTPLTFIAGNWYLSALFILSAFAFLFLRYFSFKDHEISFSQMIPWGLCCCGDCMYVTSLLILKRR
ncbi:MAG: hypothetical protein IPM96_20940 [Ignavibacteria bacterium]|nr:hypothetical protein [Ignavibacteria bacterium]